MPPPIFLCGIYDIKFSIVGTHCNNQRMFCWTI